MWGLGEDVGERERHARDDSQIPGSVTAWVVVPFPPWERLEEAPL